MIIGSDRNVNEIFENKLQKKYAALRTLITCTLIIVLQSKKCLISCISRISKVKIIYHGKCNAGAAMAYKKGFHGAFKMWLNDNGMANLLSLTKLEDDLHHS